MGRGTYALIPRQHALIILPALTAKSATHKKQAHTPLNPERKPPNNSITKYQRNNHRFRSTAVSLHARWAQRNLSY